MGGGGGGGGGAVCTLQKNYNWINLFTGIAHIVGGGIFIITPVAVATIAGPGLGFSYVLSSCIVLLTVLCYMDLGSRSESGFTFFDLFLVFDKEVKLVLSFFQNIGIHWQ